MAWVKTPCSVLLILLFIFNAFAFVLPIKVSAVTTVTLFSDGFEHSNFSSAGDPWDLNPTSSNKWNISSNFAHSGSKKARVEGSTGQTPDNFYTSTSTVGYENIKVNFWFKADDLESSDNDYVKLEWSTNGSTWSPVTGGDIDDDNDNNTWTQRQVTLPSGANNISSVYIRFNANLDSGNDTVYIDDVTITGEMIPPPPVITSETIEVNPLDMKGWEFNSDRDTWAMGTGAMVAGPSTAPLGNGSARITTPTSDNRTKLRKYLTPGTLITDIFKLEYSTYRAEPTGGVLAPAVQFDVDFDSTPVNPLKADGRIVFEPYFTYTTQDDTWQTWDALADNGTGNWWVAGPNGTSCQQSDPCTWTELKAAYPDMRISAKSLENIDTQGAILFKAGGSWAGFDGNVDKLVLGIGTHITTYDFEPIIDPCTYQNEVVYSDDSMIVDDNTAFLTWTHPVWISTTTAAKWVWSSAEVLNPTQDEYKTFKKTFNLSGNPSADATLSIATDNSYKVVVNGTEVASTTNEQNFNAFTNITVPAANLHMGQNTIEVSVHNFAMANAGPHDNPAGLIFTLYVPSKTCPGDQPYTPTPDTLQVKIYKYLDGVQATAESAAGYDFPMQATWSWTGNSGTGNYVLNESGHGGSPAYAAFTSVMTAPAMYTTHEITSDMDSNSNVLPIGAECVPGKYRLKGYRVGDSLLAAEGAPITSVVPNYNSLTHDKYVIVENETCPMPEQVSTVKICKWDASEKPLKDWTVYMYKGAKLEHLSLNTADYQGINTSSVLDQNKSYFAIASSTWANQGGNNMVDPEYSTTDNWVSNIMDGYTGYGTGILELQIQNTDGYWGPYASSTHTYAQMFTPNTTGNVNFRVFDGTDGNQNQGWFGDNSGTLGIDLYEGYAGVTGEDGCVTFENVPHGDYTLGEIMQPVWENVSGTGTVTVSEESHTWNIVNKEIVTKDDEEGGNDPLVCGEGFEPNDDQTECVAINDGGDDDGGPISPALASENESSRPGSHRRGGSSGGEVLGASTGPSCELYLTKYIKPGASNDQSEVKKLQEFLNKFMSAGLPITGFYGPLSQNWVKKFQEQNKDHILVPWKEAGLKNMESTGYVYKTTQRWINITVCPELESVLPMPKLP